jgi:hypothetical protein
MNHMPINVARQLVADRQASYEGVALRRRLRRLSRRPVYDAPVPRVASEPVPAPAVVTIVESPEQSHAKVPVDSLT